MNVQFPSLFDFLSGSSSWVYWGLVLIIVFPAMMIVLGEIAGRLWHGGNENLANAIYFMRNIVLPMLFADMFLRTVGGYSADLIPIKLMDTLVGIAAINVAVSLFNVFMLSENGIAKRRSIPKLFLDILRLFLVALGAAFVISYVWKVNLAGMLTALGVGSVVLGLALQDTLGSLFTGLAMLSARNFKRGDWIQVGTQEGVVVGMNWRTVVVRSRSGDDVVLPNLYIAQQEVTKFIAEDKWHIVSMDFELSFDHPPEMVKELMIEAALATKDVLHEPYPEARLLRYDDHAVIYSIRVYLSDYTPVPQVKSDYHSVFWYVAKRHKLIFPGRYHRFYKPPEELVPPRFDNVKALVELLMEVGSVPREEKVLAELLADAYHATFRHGEIILKQGDVAENFYILTEGRVSLNFETRELDIRDREIEDMIYIQSCEEGQFIVFKTLFNNGPTPLLVRAEGDTTAIAIPVESIETYLTKDTTLAHEIQQIISGREDIAERILDKEIPDYTTKTAESDRIEIMRTLFPNASRKNKLH